MEIRLIIVEVDASLHDPYFAAGFVAATVLSVVLAITAVRLWKRHSRARQLGSLLLFACLGASVLATPEIMYQVPRWAHATFGEGAQFCYWFTAQYHILSWVITGIALVASVVRSVRGPNAPLSVFPDPHGRT